MKRRKAAAKERSRLHIDIVEKIANPSLDFEVTNFKLFGSLREVDTEVHNTVPTLDSEYEFPNRGTSFNLFPNDKFQTLPN